MLRSPLALPPLAFLIAILLSPFTHAADSATANLPDGLYAEFTTPRGTIVAELFFEKTPLTVTSFVGLAEGSLGPNPGTPYFNGLTFHRVVPGFVVQGGDPLGTGMGGPGYEFPDEFASGLRHDAAGILSMANAGPDTNGSQFFFTLAAVNRLNYLHSVFGRVIRGLEILPQLQPGDAITTVAIHRIGDAALAFHPTPESFAALVAKTPRATPPHFDDPDNLLSPSPSRAKTFDTKLANVERATGVKLYARLFESFTPDTPNQRPGNYTGSLARQLHLPSDSVLAVYFADLDQWGLWIGDHLLEHFMGRSGTVQEFTRTGALHAAKQSLLTTAKTEAETAIAAAGKTGPVSPGHKTKLLVDAVLDALIFKFESAPSPSRR